MTHGTRGSYVNHGCRCSLCKAASSAYEKRRTRNKPASPVEEVGSQGSFGNRGISPLRRVETANPLTDIPEWLTFEADVLGATAEIVDMLEHGRIVSAHHLDRELSEEDLIWPRLYRALDNQERRDTERHKVRARVRANNAITTGRLVRKPCEVCGIAPAEGHHPDYAKPLDVRWLCRLHHDWLHHHGYSIEDMQALEQVAA